MNRIRSAPWPVRSRTRVARTATGPMPVMIRVRQVAVAHQPSAAFFGACLGVAIKEPGHLRLDRPRQQGPGAAARTSVNGSENVDGWESFKTVLSLTAYHSFVGRSGGSITPTIV